VVSSAPVADGWLGLAFAPKSDKLYVGGGSKAAVYEFNLANGTLQAARTFPLVPDKPADRDFVGDVAFSPDGRLLYAAELYKDSVAVINPQSGMVISRFKTGRRPYRILFHPDGKSFFVSHWADGSVGHYDAGNGSALTNLRLGAHPSDMVLRDGGPGDVAPGEPTWAARLFVAAAHTNSVFAVGVSSGKELSVVERINVAMAPRQPLGMTPSALALSADGRRLFVACSDANMAAVVDVSEERSHMEGLSPRAGIHGGARWRQGRWWWSTAGGCARMRIRTAQPREARLICPAVPLGVRVPGLHADRDSFLDFAVHRE
jgi:YVTN family beta-propeller protein